MSTSSPAKRSVVAATHRLVAAVSVASSACASTSAPVACSSLSAAANSMAPRAQMLSRAPSAANACAITRPSPLLAPVIITTFPLSPRSMTATPSTSARQPLIEQIMKMTNLGLLVVGQGHGLLLHGFKPELHPGQVEGVLVEHPGQESELRRLGPIVVGAKPMNRGGGRLFARGVGCQVHTFHDRFVDIHSIGPKTIDDPIVRAPRMEIRKHRVVEAVYQFGVGQILRGGAECRAQHLARTRGRGGARGQLCAEVGQRGFIETPVGHRIEHLLLARLPREMWAGSSVGGDRSREIAPRVVLRVRITDSRQQLRMGHNHVESLHECFLGYLPVATQDLRDVRLFVTELQRPALELIAQLVAQEIGERRGAQIGIEKYETAPGADLRLRQRPRGRVDMREVPLAGNVPEGAVKIPGKAVKRTAKLGSAGAAGFAQHAPAMQTRVVKCLELVWRHPHE